MGSFLLVFPSVRQRHCKSLSPSPSGWGAVENAVGWRGPRPRRVREAQGWERRMEGQTAGRKGGEESRFTTLHQRRSSSLILIGCRETTLQLLWNEEEVPNLAPTALLPQYFKAGKRARIIIRFPYLRKAPSSYLNI